VAVRKPEPLFEPIFHLVQHPVQLFFLPYGAHYSAELIEVFLLLKPNVLTHLINIKVLIESAHVKTNLAESVDYNYLLLGWSKVQSQFQSSC